MLAAPFQRSARQAPELCDSPTSRTMGCPRRRVDKCCAARCRRLTPGIGACSVPGRPAVPAPTLGCEEDRRPTMAPPTPRTASMTDDDPWRGSTTRVMPVAAVSAGLRFAPRACDMLEPGTGSGMADKSKHLRYG